MRFSHFFRTASYVLIPVRKTVDAGVIGYTRGIRIKFRGHSFDSEVAQRTYGWSEDERRGVEEYLCAHADFDAPKGIHLDVTETQTGQAPNAPPATGCMFVEVVEGNSEMCGGRTKKGSDYCARHDALVSEAVS